MAKRINESAQEQDREKVIESLKLARILGTADPIDDTPLERESSQRISDFLDQQEKLYEEPPTKEPPESPESRRGDKQWWQMMQKEFLEKYPAPNTPQTQRAAFALFHRMILEDQLIHREPKGWYGEGYTIPEEVITQYLDLKEQYEQAKSQVFEQPYESIPQLSEEARIELENIFRQLNEATGSSDDDRRKRENLSKDAEDHIKAILNLQNVRVPLSGIFRRLNYLPFGLDVGLYQWNFQLARKMFDQETTAQLGQVLAIGQEAVVYSDFWPQSQAKMVFNKLITRISGVSWSKEKEAFSRSRFSDSLKDDFYLGLTGRNYYGYIEQGPVVNKTAADFGVQVQNFQRMNSAEVSYFQLVNGIAQARESYLANLADKAGLKFIPTDTDDSWSLVEKIGHREIAPLTQGKMRSLQDIFNKLEMTAKQVNDDQLSDKIRNKTQNSLESLKLQLAKILGLSGDENPVSEKTKQKMRLPTFTSWDSFSWFMHPKQIDYSTKLFAKASPQVQRAFNEARNAFHTNEEQAAYDAYPALIDLIGREAGVEETESELNEKSGQLWAYSGYLNKVLLPRSSTVPIDDLVEAFIDTNILDNVCLRLQYDIHQRLNNYFYRLAQDAGLYLGISQI